jgi:hypothetical protein
VHGLGYLGSGLVRLRALQASAGATVLDPGCGRPARIGSVGHDLVGLAPGPVLADIDGMAERTSLHHVELFLMRGHVIAQVNFSQDYRINPFVAVVGRPKGGFRVR